MSDNRQWRRTLAWAFTLSAMVLPPDQSHAVPPTTTSHSGYSLHVLGFNDGDPYRVLDAQAEAILTSQSAKVWRFKNANWMIRNEKGAFVNVDIVTSRYPNRPARDMFEVFRADLDKDGTPEVLIVPRNAVINDGHRYAPTFLKRGSKQGPSSYTPLHAVQQLPGERFAVGDIRDLDGNGTPEFLFRGESGTRGFYHFHELLGQAGSAFAKLSVKHVDSVHYVDLDRNGIVEVVVRERVSRRGPANQWTYVDQLYRWSGEQFTTALSQFPRYHDVQTLPTLVGELIDHSDSELPILRDKVKAIRTIRSSVVASRNKPKNFDRKVVRALADYEKGRVERARLNLRELERQYPYDLQVLLGLARLHAQTALEMPETPKRQALFEKALDAAIRALTIDPESREAWWWTGVGFIQVRERSSGLASLSNAVRLSGLRKDGLAFLQARRAEPGMDGELQAAIDATIRKLGRR